MKQDAIAINVKDNVATAIRNIDAGEEVMVGMDKELVSVVATQEIPYGHKFALCNIQQGEKILKYAATIGRATRDIQKGEHVHVQNVESLRGRGDLV